MKKPVRGLRRRPSCPNLRQRHRKGVAAFEASVARLDCERWLGRWLAENIPHGGDQKSNSHRARLILKDLSITWSSSSRWQLLRPEERVSEGLTVRAAGAVTAQELEADVPAAPEDA
jgi:hypothetical protein